MPTGARVTPASGSGGGNEKGGNAGAEKGVGDSTAGRKRDTFSSTPGRARRSGGTGGRDGEAVESPKQKVDRRENQKKSKLMDDFNKRTSAEGDKTPADARDGALDDVNARGAREASAHKEHDDNVDEVPALVPDGRGRRGGVVWRR